MITCYEERFCEQRKKERKKERKNFPFPFRQTVNLRDTYVFFQAWCMYLRLGGKREKKKDRQKSGLMRAFLPCVSVSELEQKRRNEIYLFFQFPSKCLWLRCPASDLSFLSLSKIWISGHARTHHLAAAAAAALLLHVTLFSF